MSSAPTTRLQLSAIVPRPQAGFIGREGEILEGQRSLASARLLTLTGSGGCGKTRLALRLAEITQGHYRDGVSLVELATVSDPGLVPQAVAAVFDVREQPGRPILETLAEALHSRRLLLVLDNCEHVIEAAAQLAKDLLLSCPSLKILATSREALRIPGEVSRRVPSLSLPDPTHPGGDPTDSEAVRLFVDRAISLAPAFALTPSNTPAVVRICRRLDGIPLAIELAAARITHLEPEEIASRLDESFRVLAGKPGQALPHHDTLQALIDWSYDLLSDTEGLLLRRLSVFAGGWSVEAAEAVCADPPGARPQTRSQIDAGEVLDVMTALLEKSLVLVEDDSAMRYRFLETVRQYAGEKLKRSDEAATVCARHADYYLTLAMQEGSGDFTGRQNVMEREHDNFRAALDWSARTPGRAHTGLELAAALGHFWSRRGYMSEGRMRLQQLLERGSDASPDARAGAFRWLGNLAWLEGRYEESWSSYDRALAFYEEIGDRRGVAISLCGLGNTARYRADSDRARSLFERSLAIYREIEDRKAIALLLNNLGAVASNENQIDLAISLYQEGLAISRELNDRWGVASRLGNLAEVTTRKGDNDAAAAMHRESLALWAELGDPRSIAEGLEMFVPTLCALGRMELAATLLGAVEALRKSIHCPRAPVDEETIQRALDSARAALGETRFDKAWSEGLAMGPDQAVAKALTK